MVQVVQEEEEEEGRVLLDFLDCFHSHLVKEKGGVSGKGHGISDPVLEGYVRLCSWVRWGWQRRSLAARGICLGSRGKQESGWAVNVRMSVVMVWAEEKRASEQHVWTSSSEKSG